MTVRSTLLLLLATAALIGAAFWFVHRPVDLPQGTPAQGEWTHLDLIGDTAQAPVGRSQLQRISLSANGLGLVAGSAARVWRTMDGGGTWQMETMPAVVAQAVAIREDSLGLLGLGNGRIVRSPGAGGSWQMVRPPGRGQVMDFAWSDAASAYAAVRGALLRSADSGNTWLPLTGLDREYHAIRLRGNLGVMVGGGGTILRSIDRGLDWQLVPAPTRALLRGVAFAGDTVVVAVGSDGTILRSTDGGISWRPVNSGVETNLRAVAFADDRHGVAVGFFGTILVTIDAGSTWRPIASGTHAHLLDVAIDPAGAPVVVGYFDTILRGPSLRPAGAGT